MGEAYQSINQSVVMSYSTILCPEHHIRAKLDMSEHAST